MPGTVLGNGGTIVKAYKNLCPHRAYRQKLNEVISKIGHIVMRLNTLE